ncbi:nitrogen fixation protein NifZ [Bradyrhizobium sp. USDA 4461]
MNEGSLPDTEPDGLVLGAGATGEIVRVAIHTEAGVPVYTVDFGERRLTGCL